MEREHASHEGTGSNEVVSHSENNMQQTAGPMPAISAAFQAQVELLLKVS